MTTFKNKLLKLIMTGMLVLAAFAFISCGGDAPEDNGGSDDGSGTGAVISAEEAAAKLNQIGDYVIVSEVTSTGSEPEVYELGRKGNTYWAFYEGDYDAFVIDGENIHTYYGDEGAGGKIEWTFDETVPYTEDGMESYIDNMQIAFSTWLYYGNYLASALEKNGSGSVAGRSCTRYTYSNTVSYGVEYASATYDVYIDNATGVTMKVVMSGSTNEGSGSFSYIVKSFKTGNSVTAPNLPEPPAMD